MSLGPGVFPAAVTPFDAKGKVDHLSVARLLTHFRTEGCRGAVVAGTNGEGPSLSAVEKRDLFAAAARLAAPDFAIIAGIATASLDEANWLIRQAKEAGVAAALLMPPAFFRDAEPEGLERWFRAVLSRTELPILIYNFPKRTGIILTGEFLARLADLPSFVGIKDSSGNADNLADYRSHLPGRELYVGDETLLLDALKEGWTGTISGAANSVGRWLAAILDDNGESAEIKFQLLRPVLEALRSSPQPATHKQVLQRMGVIAHADLRLPLLDPAVGSTESVIAMVEALCG